MRLIKKIRPLPVFAIGGIFLLSACAATGITYQSATSADGQYRMFQTTAYSGRSGDVLQSVFLVWDNMANRYVMEMSTGAEPLSTSLMKAILSPGMVASLITGQYGIRIADKGTCQAGALCGTLVQVNSVSGSVSGANATIKTGNN